MLKKIFATFSLSLLFCTTAVADPLRDIVIFGDSLSDNGNLYKALFKIIPKDPPYYAGRFTNGPVWSDELSAYFQKKYQIPTYNYAIGGTTVILRSPFEGSFPYTMDQEITSYLVQTGTSDRSRSLFIVWIGANDYTIGAKNVDKATTEVVNKIVYDIKRLINNGAKHFFIINLPDLSKTPFAKTVSYSQNLHDLTISHNIKLGQAISALQKAYPAIELMSLDVREIMDDMLSHPDVYNKKYDQHFSNFDTACWEGGYTLAKDKRAQATLNAELKTVLPTQAADEITQHITNSPSLSEAYQVSHLYQKGYKSCEHSENYVFWDKVHPSTQVHHIMALLAIEALEKKK